MGQYVAVIVIDADRVICKIYLSRTEIFTDGHDFPGHRTLLTDQVLLCA